MWEHILHGQESLEFVSLTCGTSGTPDSAATVLHSSSFSSALSRSLGGVSSTSCLKLENNNQSSYKHTCTHAHTVCTHTQHAHTVCTHTACTHSVHTHTACTHSVHTHTACTHSVHIYIHIANTHTTKQISEHCSSL